MCGGRWLHPRSFAALDQHARRAWWVLAKCAGVMPCYAVARPMRAVRAGERSRLRIGGFWSCGALPLGSLARQCRRGRGRSTSLRVCVRATAAVPAHAWRLHDVGSMGTASADLEVMEGANTSRATPLLVQPQPIHATVRVCQSTCRITRNGRHAEVRAPRANAIPDAPAPPARRPHAASHTTVQVAHRTRTSTCRAPRIALHTAYASRCHHCAPRAMHSILHAARDAPHITAMRAHAHALACHATTRQPTTPCRSTLHASLRHSTPLRVYDPLHHFAPLYATYSPRHATRATRRALHTFSRVGTPTCAYTLVHARIDTSHAKRPRDSPRRPLAPVTAAMASRRVVLHPHLRHSTPRCASMHHCTPPHVAQRAARALRPPNTTHIMLVANPRGLALRRCGAMTGPGCNC